MAGQTLHAFDRSRASFHPGNCVIASSDAKSSNSLFIPGVRDLRLVGSGATSDVFVGTQVGLDRTVAVKVLRATSAGAGFREFEREACVLALLAAESDGVLMLHFVGSTEDGLPYSVMEFAEGGSLAGHVQRFGPLNAFHAAGVAGTIGQVLAAAHGRGLLHRDVKPGNVLICRDGSVRLADFGLAGAVDDRDVVAAFTPSYAAPEVLASDWHSAASDVFGLAATLYASLTAAPPPRRRESVESALSQTGASGELVRLIAKGLCIIPADRPQAAEFATLSGPPLVVESWLPSHFEAAPESSPLLSDTTSPGARPGLPLDRQDPRHRSSLIAAEPVPGRRIVLVTALLVLVLGLVYLVQAEKSAASGEPKASPSDTYVPDQTSTDPRSRFDELQPKAHS